MNLLLITDKKIIKQIFNLVTSKLDIELTMSDINVAHKKFDLIVIEDSCLDSKFNTASYANTLGIVTKDTSTYKSQCDFILNKPFLPSQLISILTNLKTVSQSIAQATIVETNQLNKAVMEDATTTAVDFIETLASDIGDEIAEESDESVLPTAFVEKGGILDTNELSKIQDILNDDTTIDANDNLQVNKEEIDEDWINLSDIIDKAIDDVKEYEFKRDTPIKLLLNDYSIKELSPLLNRLDQEIVDTLTSGEEITLQLKADKK